MPREYQRRKLYRMPDGTVIHMGRNGFWVLTDSGWLRAIDTDTSLRGDWVDALRLDPGEAEALPLPPAEAGMSTLEVALLIALEAHANQPSKDRLPYVFHPIRLMLKMDTEEEMATALLHDVLEDSKDLTPEKLLQRGILEDVVEAVQILTNEENGDEEAYYRLVERCATNPIALRVKIADLKDNMDVTRLSELDDEAIKRLRKYHKAYRMLTEQPPDSD